MTNVYDRCSRIITVAFRDLLESHHLYQAVRVDFEEVVKSLAHEYGGPTPERLLAMLSEPWSAQGPHEATRPIVGTQTNPTIAFQLTDAKMFCAQCERREPYNVKHIVDYLPNGTGQPRFDVGSKNIQCFVVNLQCQSCKGVPEVFLLLREGFKITLSGRAPIESVDVPGFIPKGVRKFYSDSLLAHQSGQTLAGNFMLRTVIEQWSRDWVSRSDFPSKGELLNGRSADMVEAYNQSLPADLRDRLPSFSVIYKTLSDDIHAAKGDPAVFESSLADLNRHFDARRLFKIDG